MSLVTYSLDFMVDCECDVIAGAAEKKKKVKPWIPMQPTKKEKLFTLGLLLVHHR